MRTLFCIISSCLLMGNFCHHRGFVSSCPHSPICAQEDIIDGHISDTIINNAAFLLVDKESMTLSVVDYNGNNIYVFPIACGRNYGNKMRQGDKKTPEGVFRIKGIQSAKNWTHDFGDGKGEISGAYGPWFIRIDVLGHNGIGIHGTHDDGSIGKRETEGCIRLRNDDVRKLKNVVFVGMMVVILPSRMDILSNK